MDAKIVKLDSIEKRYLEIGEEMLKDDKLYLDAEQCLKYGICDEIT